MAERRRLGTPTPLPTPCAAVTGGNTWPNQAWLKWLTKFVTRNGVTKREGRDPKLIDPEILAAAGHPPRSATTCIRAYLRDMDLPRNPIEDRGLKRVRELCLDCTGGVLAEVTNCRIIACPLWAHRMGHNPHNAHKHRIRRIA